MESSIDSAQPRAEIPFVTDPDIVRRLQLAEDGVKHAEYHLGVVQRELADLRVGLEPRAA